MCIRSFLQAKAKVHVEILPHAQIRLLEVIFKNCCQEVIISGQTAECIQST